MASNAVVSDEDVVSADEPPKTVGGMTPSQALDYDEALGYYYGRKGGPDAGGHQQPNHSRDKLTADQMINDVDSIDRLAAHAVMTR